MAQEPTGNSPDRTLLPHHQALLDDSAIAPEVARARGYWSATKRSELEQLGFRPRQAHVPALVIPIRDCTGSTVLYQVRPDSPRKTDRGRELKYETPTGASLALDVHPHIRESLRDPKVMLVITEGSRKVDAAVSKGLCCVGVLGVDGWRGTNEMGGKTALADFEAIALNGREVLIAYDSDVMTKNAVNMACARLKRFLTKRGAQVRLIYLPEGDGGEKIGLDDFFADGKSLEDLMACVGQPKIKAALKPSKTETDVARLVEFATAETPDSNLEGAELLFHTATHECFATINRNGIYETWGLRSRAFKAYLAHRHYEEIGSSPSADVLNRTILLLEGKALFDGPQLDVHTRLALGGDGAIYLDLADEQWRAVRIDAVDWNIVSRPPVRFRRAGGMLPLPTPEAGGDVGGLRDFVNVGSDDDFALLVGWLIAALRYAGPYMVLILQGEQGSAKSTTSRVLRRLIDPNKAALRSQPREPRDLAVTANNAWTIVLDNLSGVGPWLSDGLCRIATGGGFATRQLYTDAEEQIFDSTRPILLNGIDSVATRGDLLDRAILLNLPRLQQVREERDLWTDLEQVRPALLGGLLDAVVVAIRRESEVKLDTRVRMADAARWVVAAEPALPWKEGTFLAAYAGNRSDANDLALEASPVAAELRALLGRAGRWEGTATELVEVLEERAAERTTRLKSWPRTARTLSNAIRRLAPSLRATGVEMDFRREPHTGRRLIHLAFEEPAIDRHRRHRPHEGHNSGGSEGDERGDDLGRNRQDRHPANVRNCVENAEGDHGDASIRTPLPVPEMEVFDL